MRSSLFSGPQDTMGVNNSPDLFAMTISPFAMLRPIRFRRFHNGAVRSLVLLPLLALSMAGCATKRDVRTLQATMQEMHAQNQTLLRELQRDQRAQQDTLRAASRALQDLRGEMAGRFSALEGEILTLQAIQGVSQQQLASIRDDLERRENTSPFGQSSVTVPTSGASDLYESGTAAFNRGSYAAAETLFRDILDLHPGSPLVPDARFYLALILVERGDRAAAILSFQEIPELHPSSAKVPDALFRIGRLHLELGSRDEAVAYFNRVAESYPGSDAAVLARTELQNLR